MADEENRLLMEVMDDPQPSEKQSEEEMPAVSESPAEHHLENEPVLASNHAINVAEEAEKTVRKAQQNETPVSAEKSGTPSESSIREASTPKSSTEDIGNQVRPPPTTPTESVVVINGSDKQPSIGNHETKDESPISLNDERLLNQKYDEVLLKIEAQNKVLAELKNRIKEKCLKFPRTACEEREICNFKICMEQENLKLQCLVRDARNLQAQDPTRHWSPIALETTLDEEWLPIRMNVNAMTRCFGVINENSSRSRAESPNHLRCSSNDTIGQRACDVHSIKLRKSSQSKRRKRQNSKEFCRSYSMQDKLVADNANLESERYKLQEELLCRDSFIESLQKKVNVMQCQLNKLRRNPNEIEDSEVQDFNNQLPKLKSRINDQETVKCLSNAMAKIQNSLDCLKLEVEEVKKCRGSSPAVEPKPRGSKDNYQNLKRKYCELLETYTSKEHELAEMKSKVDVLIRGKQSSRSDSDNADNTEITLLRQKLQESCEEHAELKIIICEQSKQSDDYRQKYMNSLQKIEELKCILRKMEDDNKRVEDQINLEIQRIKDKFQEKLKDWSHLPQALENEQLKLAQCCKEKDDLELKLRIVSRELKTLKSQNRAVHEEKNDPDKVHRLEQELVEIRSKYDAMSVCKSRLCEEYEQVKKELDSLRQESAKIICRSKERAENNQATLQKHIDELEHELAQCRATACLSVADREEVIKNMQSQLNCLALSFDSAQHQIKSLKDHILYMSKGAGTLCSRLLSE